MGSPCGCVCSASLPLTLSLISNIASVPFIGILESDNNVDQLDNESDSEEETEKVQYRLKVFTFYQGFAADDSQINTAFSPRQ